MVNILAEISPDFRSPALCPKSEFFCVKGKAVPPNAFISVARNRIVYRMTGLSEEVIDRSFDLSPRAIGFSPPVCEGMVG